MSEEKGAFELFALVLRDDAPNKWDLLVASPWVERDKKGGLAYISRLLQETLGIPDLFQISRIVIIDRSNPALAAFLRAMHVEHGMAEIQESSFFGLQIKHAFLITSRRLEDEAPNKPLQPTPRGAAKRRRSTS